MNFYQSNLLSGYRNSGFQVNSLGGMPVANSSYWASIGSGSTAAAQGGLNYSPMAAAASNVTASKAGGAGKMGSNIGYGMLAQGIADTTNEILNMYLTRTTARAKADAYRSQARLVQQAATQKNKYLNEAIGQQVWNLYDQRRALEGQQITAMGASGFTDVSAGDKRLLRDTRLKTEAAVEGLNRSAFLQQFETNRAAAMEASRLEYAAKMQDRVRKNASGLRGLARVGINLGLSAAGAYFGTTFGKTGYGNDINVYGSVA